jgi:hypothetical protein
MMDYDNAEFWTEERCIQQRAAFLNVLLNLDQFPKANEAALWAQVEALEAHMLTTFATVRTMQVLTGQAAT